MTNNNSDLRFHVCDTNIGYIGVIMSDGGLREITMPRPTHDAALHDLIERGAQNPATKAELGTIPAAIKALVAGRAPKEGVTFDWAGITPFRRKVLEECARIPAGQTTTYAELAAKVGRPGAARAVGRVMATNPWPFLVPCHRVLGSDGTLHGYGGGLPMKEALLKAEGAKWAGAKS